MLIFSMLVSLPIQAMLKPLERRKIESWQQQQDKDQLAKLQQDLGEGGFLRFVREQITVRADYVEHISLQFFPWLMGQIVPAVVVGVAAIESFSFEEEQKSARIPSQLFAEAAGRLHARLDRLAPGIQLRVHMLPTVVRVRSPLGAQRVRRWLGYDVVLWGSFTDQAARRLLINLATRRASARQPGGRKGHAVQVERELGPLRPSGLPSSVLVDQAQPIDGYVALLLGFAKAIAGRQFVVRPYSRWLDPIVANKSALEELVERLLLDLAQGPVWHERDFSGRELAVASLVEWTKDQLMQHAEGWRRDKRLDLSVLLAAIDRCADVAKDSPDAHYMLAVRHLMNGDIEAAQSSADAGWKLDRTDRYRGWAYMTAVARRYLSDAGKSYGKELRIPLALAALHAILAAKMDADATASALARDLRGEFRHRQLEIGIGGPPTAAEKILYRIAQLEIPSPDRGEGTDAKAAAGPIA
jgi:hypothetical protein